MLSLNLRTRRRSWIHMRRQRQFPFYSSPAFAEGLIALGGRDMMVHCINAATGKAIWTLTTRARRIVSGHRRRARCHWRSEREYVLPL